MTAHEGLPEPKRYVPYMDGMDLDPQAMMVNEQDDVEHTGDAVFIRETDYTAMRSALEARCGELEGALRRLGSMEAFDLGRRITADDTELLARIDYARAMSSNSRKEGEG